MSPSIGLTLPFDCRWCKRSESNPTWTDDRPTNEILCKCKSSPFCTILGGAEDIFWADLGTADTETRTGWELRTKTQTDTRQTEAELGLCYWTETCRECAKIGWELGRVGTWMGRTMGHGFVWADMGSAGG
jgi:hypothetical protein